MKILYISTAIILILCFIPFYIALAYQVDFNKEVNSPYLNGLITACGIFVAFISASVISKAQYLDSFDFWLIRCTLVAFITSILRLSHQLIVFGYPTILELTLFSTTVSLAAFSAWDIMTTLYRRTRSA